MQAHFDGNTIKHIGHDICELPHGRTWFLHNGPYEYFIFKSAEKESLLLEDMTAFSILIVKKPQAAVVKISNMQSVLSEGDVVQVDSTHCEISFSSKGCAILVAGSRSRSGKDISVIHTKSQNLYKVLKPWGHELWLNKEHPLYAFKKIFIKSGTKTSLQYHRKKRETNVLLEGQILLHYRDNLKVPIDQVTDISTSSLPINPISSIDVAPLSLHRIEAISDTILYEVSTPHLDDVIRVIDDTRRLDGRISQEHYE